MKRENRKIKILRMQIKMTLMIMKNKKLIPVPRTLCDE